MVVLIRERRVARIVGQEETLRNNSVDTLRLDDLR